jgi:transposase
VLLPCQHASWQVAPEPRSTPCLRLDAAIKVIGIDIGKNSFRVVGLDGRGTIVLRQKWSRGSYSKGPNHDFPDAEAIAEAVQRPKMKFVATKTADQLDLQAPYRVR